MIWQPEFTDKTLSRKPGAVHAVRQQRSKALLTSLNEWMVEKNGTLSKKSRLGEAFSYVLNQWDAGFAPIFPDICYHLTHYKPAAADIPVASDNPAHYADAIRYNARTPLQGSLLPLTRLVWA